MNAPTGSGRRKLERSLWSIVIWALYGISLVLPVIDLSSPSSSGSIDIHGPIAGWGALTLGWIPPICIPWSANYFLLGSWIAYLCGKISGAFVASIIGLGLSLSTLVVFHDALNTLRIGYGLWVAAFAALVIATGLGHRQDL